MAKKVVWSALGVGMAACVSFTAWGDLAEPDGSLTRPVHLIPLLDAAGEKIIPRELGNRPFSIKTTCGDCHAYENIHQGWHFDVPHATEVDARNGEPSFLVDKKTGTQLPVSYRAWKRIWRPEEAGLDTTWAFVKQFGRHLPGGFGESEEEEFDPEARWHISGPLEVNCLACHNRDAAQNMSEWTFQVMRENHQWAAAGSSGLGVVTGMASRLSDTYDYWSGPNPDEKWAVPPVVHYDESAFDWNNRVFFDLTRDVPEERCYYCHSTDVVGSEREIREEDIHLQAGMTCVDCHRNGIDHRIVRGFEGETQFREDDLAEGFSCKACHLGSDNVPAGRLGAPVPLHKGLPESHLEKITCTACHAGPTPGTAPHIVRTSRANRLGIHGKAKWATDLPYIASPVFVRNEAGKVEPQHAVWPAFWAILTDGMAVSPMDIAVVTAELNQLRRADWEAREEEAAREAAEAESVDEDESAVEEGVAPEQEPAPEPEPDLTEEEVLQVLRILSSSVTDKNELVYVAAGRLFRLDSTGALSGEKHDAAKPYLWPIGHKVRPTAYALGAQGCNDCHGNGSAFFYGKVTPLSPVELPAITSDPMYVLQGYDPALLKSWALGTQLHGWYLGLMVVLAVILAVLAARYGIVGLETVARRVVTHRREGG